MASPRLPWNRPTGVVIGVLTLALSSFTTLISPETKSSGRISHGEIRESKTATHGRHIPELAKRSSPWEPSELRRLAHALEYHEPVWHQTVRSFTTSHPYRFFPHLPDPEDARADAVEELKRADSIPPIVSLSLVRALAATQDRVLAGRIMDVLGTSPEATLPGLLAQASNSHAVGVERSLECLARMVGGRDSGSLDLTMVEAVARMQVGAEHPTVRLAAVRLVHALGMEALPTVEVLLFALGDAEAAVRVAAAESLGARRVHPERCVPHLARRVLDVDQEVRVAVANALGAFGRSAARGAPALGEAARQADLRGALAATRALGRLDTVSEAALNALLTNLSRPEAILRAAAVMALGRMGSKAGTQAAEAVVGALSDQDAFVRRSAAQALAGYGPMGAPGVDVLTGLLRTGDEPMRVLAAEALGAIGAGAARAIPALVAARNNNQSVMSRPVLEALARIEGAGTIDAPALGLEGTP